MSQRPISRSPDLQRLRGEGFVIEVRSGHLLVRDVPFVRADRTVSRGTLVMPLTTAGDHAVQPSNHVAYWIGEFPCDGSGAQMSFMGSPGQGYAVDSTTVAQHTFSRKPKPSDAYVDYYEKVTTYVGLIEGQAHLIDQMITARTHRALALGEEDSVFRYTETASSRSGISAISQKVEGGKIAIVGLGGTGSYVLDLVAKAPVAEIHLYDADRLLSHNAFRSPGAPSLNDLESNPTKVDWFASQYDRMRRGIVPHRQRVDSSNVQELGQMTFVFLCLDDGPSKAMILDYLCQSGTAFVDAGMGLFNQEGALGGTVRVTRGAADHFGHIERRIPLSGQVPNEYDNNIQIAELNCLNAALAVIRWKKSLGFYHDFRREYSSTYSVCTNSTTNDEVEDEGQDPPT